MLFACNNQPIPVEKRKLFQEDIVKAILQIDVTQYNEFLITTDMI